MPGLADLPAHLGLAQRVESIERAPPGDVESLAEPPVGWREPAVSQKQPAVDREPQPLADQFEHHALAEMNCWIRDQTVRS